MSRYLGRTASALRSNLRPQALAGPGHNYLPLNNIYAIYKPLTVDKTDMCAFRLCEFEEDSYLAMIVP